MGESPFVAYRSNIRRYINGSTSLRQLERGPIESVACSGAIFMRPLNTRRSEHEITAAREYSPEFSPRCVVIVGVGKRGYDAAH